MQFAQERASVGRKSRVKISKIFVLGAILNVNCCLDLADSIAIAQWGSPTPKRAKPRAFELLRFLSDGRSLWRELDCAVTNLLHQIQEDSELPPYGTVRGLFGEGAAIYEGTGVSEFNHIQICLRDVSCILGYFRLRRLRLYICIEIFVSKS